MKHKQSKPKSIARELRERLWEPLNTVPYSKTREQYRLWITYFVRFCRDKNYKTYEEIATVECLQSYADELVRLGKTASTIHSYLAAPCKALGIPMNRIQKPLRYVAENRRGRNVDADTYTTSTDMDSPKWEKLVAFQRIAGLRRAELRRLTKESLVVKDGYLSLEVWGKGKKHHFQRLSITKVGENPALDAFINSYFTPLKCGQNVFEDKLFQNNRLNLHGLRAEKAKTTYELLLSEVRKNPFRRDELLQEIRHYWDEFNLNQHTGRPRAFPWHSVQGMYHLRGKTRALAKQQGMPLQYDRLVLMYVSVFMLSHWRTDVTVGNYLLFYQNTKNKGEEK